MKRTAKLLCATAAATLALSACADDSGGGGGGGGGSDADGPIKLMVLFSQTGPTGVDPNGPTGAEAAAAAINEDGGINGRDIEVIVCDTASDPNKSTECARKAIDEGVVAIVGSFDPIGITVSLPVLEAAGIPSLAPIAVQPIEYQSPVSFPVVAGGVAGGIGMVAAAEDANCTKLGTFGDQQADGGQTENIVNAAEKAGIETFAVNLPTGAVDVGPVVAQALDENPDCIAFAQGAPTAVQLFTAIRRSGSTAQLISATPSLQLPYVQSLGDVAEGLLATQDTPSPDSPELQPFRDDMAAHEPDADLTPFSLGSWYGVQLFKQVAEGLDEISSATVLEATSKLTDVELPGMETVDFTKTQDSKLYPRLFNPTVQIVKVEGAKYVATDGEWKNVADYLP